MGYENYGLNANALVYGNVSFGGGHLTGQRGSEAQHLL